MALKIAVANQKGGAGKTTISNSLADALKERGKKVLTIDVDSQCNTSDFFRADIDGTNSLYDVLVDKEPLETAIQKKERGDIIACSPLLNKADRMLVEPGDEYRLKEAIETSTAIEEYDYIIFDTPPHLGMLLSNALTAADGVIIPITPDRATLQGLAQLSETIDKCKRYSNVDLTVLGILFNKYVKNEVLTKATEESLPSMAETLEFPLFNSHVHYTAAARKAQTQRENLFTYAPDSKTAIDVLSLADEIIERGKSNE